MKNWRSENLYEELSKLKFKSLDVLKGVLTKKGKIDLKATDVDFDDMSNNRIVAVDKDQVYFDDFGGVIETYPLHELDIQDVLYILTQVE